MLKHIYVPEARPSNLILHLLWKIFDSAQLLQPTDYMRLRPRLQRQIMPTLTLAWSISSEDKTSQQKR